MTPPRWLHEDGPDSDVVVSTRCRLARNVAGIPFPWRADELQRKLAAETILREAERAGGPLQDAETFSASRLSEEDHDRLIEWQVASKAWAESGSHKWVITTRDGWMSLLVNEEDHLRIQVVKSGVLVESCWELATEAERAIGRNVRFAWAPQFGYQTASLTNAGTGLRVGVMLHLPGLARLGRLEACLTAVAELGSAVRGPYGEGTTGTADLFQVSNRRAFGLHPQDIVAGVSASAGVLMQAERDARGELWGSGVGRSGLSGELENAFHDLWTRDASQRELLSAVSLLRLGISESLIVGNLAAVSEWIALAGLGAADESVRSPQGDRFESMRRSAALRQRLRTLVETSGTFVG